MAICTECGTLHVGKGLVCGDPACKRARKTRQKRSQRAREREHPVGETYLVLGPAARQRIAENLADEGDFTPTGMDRVRWRLLCSGRLDNLLLGEIHLIRAWGYDVAAWLHLPVLEQLPLAE